MQRTRGLSETKIRETIDELIEASVEPTTTSIRNRLGTGSYTTISTALEKWRVEVAAREQSNIPAVPPALRSKLESLWQEAVTVAQASHEVERSGFVADRSEWQRERAELVNEVARLESIVSEQREGIEALSDVRAECVELQSELVRERDRNNLTTEAANSEIARLRSDLARQVEKVGELSERAARAETELRMVNTET